MTIGFSRREVLAALLGAPFALAACDSRRRRSELPPGELVGASHGRGHRVRSRERVRPSDSAWERAPVVIVGGGVAGLSAAWRLARAGFQDFVLLELEDAPGGTARSGTGVVPYPWGAHYIAAPSSENAPLIALLDEMKVTDGRDDRGDIIIKEEHLVRDPEERVFFRGTWYEGLYLHEGESPDDEAQLVRFHDEIAKWAAWRDDRGRRAFAVPAALGSDDARVAELDRLSMAEWLARNDFTSPRLLWLVDYACRDDYGTRPDRTSAWAGLFYFAARRSGRDSRPFITWPEGNGRLVGHLASRVKERVRLGLTVVEVEPVARESGSGVNVVALDADGRARGFRADQVVFCAPGFVARHAVVPWRDSPPEHLSAFEYGSWWVANLHLSGRPAEIDGFPPAWDNVLYESPSLGYVTATHQRGLDHGPTVLTYYFPLVDGVAAATRANLMSCDRDDLAETCLADLERAHPDLRSLVERLDVARWGHAMIRPRPGFIWGGARAAAARPHRGIHFAHTELSGVALFEEALHHGVRAAEEVLTARDVKFAPLGGRA